MSFFGCCTLALLSWGIHPQEFLLKGFPAAHQDDMDMFLVMKSPSVFLGKKHFPKRARIHDSCKPGVLLVKIIATDWTPKGWVFWLVKSPYFQGNSRLFEILFHLARSFKVFFGDLEVEFGVFWVPNLPLLTSRKFIHMTSEKVWWKNWVGNWNYPPVN